MIVPVMAISNLVLTQQIYSEEKNGAHAHYREPVPLSEDSGPLHLVHNGDFKISARKAKKLSEVCFDVRNRPFSIRASRNLYIKR